MNKKAQQIEEEKLKEAELQNGSEAEYASELLDIDPSLAGHLSELEGAGPQENLPIAQKSRAKREEDAADLLEDRLLLRASLLEKAPPEPQMRRDIYEKLELQKIDLNKQLRRLKRTKLYWKLSQVLAELRLVVHRMRELRHMAYDLLVDLWLHLVHKFATS